ncbi:MAG: kelch repeat-containing protein [Thermoplasmata archaeon]|nr:kelch repeat-containing protein [Thermoplasmata archaeon]
MRALRALVRSGLVATLPMSALVLLLVVPTGIGSSMASSHVSGGPAATVHPTAVHPAPRWVDPMVYDAKDGYVVLFGGGGPTKNFADTWTYQAGVWTKLTPPTHPSARNVEGLVYDARDGKVLLFGGGDSTGYLGDTWEFSAGLWTQLHLALAPSPRGAMGMAYDAKNRYVVLFGGEGPGPMLNDTWAFANGHWKLLSPTTAPTPRRSFGMTYDAADGYVVLFGGLAAGDANDTWTFSGGVWTQLSPTTAPGVRVALAMVYDSKAGTVILFGGRDDNTLSLYHDTWAFLGGAWTLQNTTTSPPARQWPGMAYDGASGRVVLFGGGSTAYAPVSVLGDTHTYSAGVWS